MAGKIWSAEDIISDALDRAPEAQMGSKGEGWMLSRWRQFVGSYALPALPDPMFVVHISGKPNVRHWDRDAWSEAWSVPGCATIVPAGQPTRWLVDGELDVVTLSLTADRLNPASGADRFKRMKFAFSDPLGVALARQVLAEMYAPQTEERDAYLRALVTALRAHVGRGPEAASAKDIPVASFCASRIHTVIGAILAHPEQEHTLEKLATSVNVTPAHFCRMFKRATGLPPHQFVMKARLDRARQMLEQSEQPIGLIADYLGFGSQSHFTRAFKQSTGLSPSEFRTRTIKTLQ